MDDAPPLELAANVAAAMVECSPPKACSALVLCTFLLLQYVRPGASCSSSSSINNEKKKSCL